MGIEPLPDWVIPPESGFTAEDFLGIPGLPKGTELIDGSLVFMSPQAQWHGRVITYLTVELDRLAPDDLRAEREMVVCLDKDQVPEPDVLVVAAEAYDRAAGLATYYRAEDVVLAVEVVSPSSEARDRDTKPRKYASAGIRHFWRLEREDGRVVAYTYERDPATGCYALTGIHHDRLKVTVPFDIEIDLTAPGVRRR